MRTVVTVGAALVIAGCGGSKVQLGGETDGGGSGSLAGTVSALSFTVASEVATAVAASSCPLFFCEERCVAEGQLNIFLTSRADVTCATALANEGSGKNVGFASLDALELSVLTAGGDVAAGTYAISSSSALPYQAAATFTTTTSACASDLDVKATGGAIVLTQVSATEVQGTYDVTFGSEGSFNGSFDVTICGLTAGQSPLATNCGNGAVCTP
jgi:hypothetical protein